MGNTKAKFEVGDWVLLNDDALFRANKYSTQNQNAKIFIENYKYPRQVLSLIETGFSYLYMVGKGLKIRERDFRLATEKEMKEQEIRSKFII